jgi:hypothetical protein
MEATIREVRVNGAAGAANDDARGSAHYAENNLLSELPGLAIGLVTLIYIATSLAALL